MSDPPRLDQGPAAKLLRAGRADRMPSCVIRRTLSASFAALSTSAALRAAALTKLGLLAASGGAIALAAHAIVTRPVHVENVESARVTTIATVAGSTSASAPPPEPTPSEDGTPRVEPSPPPSSSPSAPRPRATASIASIVPRPAPRADELPREIDLLGRARAQIAAGAPERADALLDEYERTVTDKQLREEARELRLRVKALRAPTP